MLSKLIHYLNIPYVVKVTSLIKALPLIALVTVGQTNQPAVLLTGEKELIILHTNDLHSRLTGYAPESQYSPLVTNNDSTIGGFARIASLIKQEKAKHPETVLLVDAGDFLMGTFFHALEPEDGFQLRLMNTMGYEAVCLGNHEFDFGIGTTAEIISASANNGDIPPLLLTNIEFNPKESEDDGLDTLFQQGIINPYKVIEKNGLRIGLFGLMGVDAADVAPYVRPANFTNPVKTAKKMSKKLKTEEQVDLVICLSHSGLYMNEKGEWEGEDVELAKKVKDIDVIISGHTHTCLSDPVVIDGTPIVQTGAYGANLGRIHVTYGQDGMNLVSADLLPVNDAIAGDQEVHQLIEQQKVKIRNNVLKDIRLSYDESVVSTAFMLECDEINRLENSNLGPFLADAIYYYVNAVESENIDIAMIAAGVIRDQMVPGEQTIADLFRIVSLGMGNDRIPGAPLAKVYVTGNELKKIIEVLLIGYKSSPGNYVYYGGLRVKYDPEKGFLRRVQSLETGDENKGYCEIDISKKNDALYSIVANAYMLEFVGMLKKKSFGLVNVKPKLENGEPMTDIQKVLVDMDPGTEGVQEGKEWMALYYYITLMDDTNGDNIPDIPEKYRNPEPRVIPVTP
jgi:5'-nucleotidase/UDP-sugar diphosphatase